MSRRKQRRPSIKMVFKSGNVQYVSFDSLKLRDEFYDVAHRGLRNEFSVAWDDKHIVDLTSIDLMLKI